MPAQDVNDNAVAAQFVDSVKGVVATATGPPVVYQEASTTVVRAFQLALFYAFVMVTAIIWLFLRDPRDVLLVVVPILIASGATAGMTVLIGMPLNYANIIALPLLVGLGVDNGIHVVHRMRTDPQANELFNTSTLRAVLASGLTTVASFGNLAFSAHVGTASMGKLLALGLAISMAATLIVLPAWLKVFGRGARATKRSRIRNRSAMTSTSFVTGANGFLGSAVVRALLAEGGRVRALVRAGSDRRNLEQLDVETSKATSPIRPRCAPEWTAARRVSRRGRLSALGGRSGADVSRQRAGLRERARSRARGGRRANGLHVERRGARRECRSQPRRRDDARRASRHDRRLQAFEVPGRRSRARSARSSSGFRSSS